MSLKQRKIEFLTKDKIETQHVLRVIGFFLLLSYCAINESPLVIKITYRIIKVVC